MKTGKLGQWHLEYAQFGCADTLQKKKKSAYFEQYILFPCMYN